MLERGVSVHVQPIPTHPVTPKPPKTNTSDSFAEAAKQPMAEAKAAAASNGAQPTMTDIRLMKQRTQQRQSARIQEKER